MGSAPSGYQTPKTNWAAGDIPTAQDFNRIENNIRAIDEGSRTIEPTQVPSGNTGTLRQLLDWFANRIKAITGKTNWYDAPDTTLAAAKAHIDAAAPHSGHETPAGAQAKVNAHANDGTAHGIGDKSTLLTTAKTTIVEAINEVFQLGNSVKANVVGALLSIDQALPLTEDSSWNEIISAIGQISVKKVATGTASISSQQYLFDSKSYYAVTGSGLAFAPSIIIVYYTQSGYFVVTVYCAGIDLRPDIAGEQNILLAGGTQLRAAQARLDGEAAYIQQFGDTYTFRLPYYSKIGAETTAQFIAIE